VRKRHFYAIFCYGVRWRWKPGAPAIVFGCKRHCDQSRLSRASKCGRVTPHSEEPAHGLACAGDKLKIQLEQSL
jgi:hypothetical protein